MKEKLFSGVQRLLPHHLISRVCHYFAECKIGWFKNFLIQAFINQYNVDLSDAQENQIESYESFNEFFTRPLKEGTRSLPQDSKTIISPADGFISQIGKINNGRIFQAKGHDYSLIELLGDDACLGQEFMEGKFSTIYLSPSDYHRVHIPITGKLRRMIHIPGRLFSVNQGTVDNISNLFARNERVVSIFDTEHGPMAVIMIGAMIVASIETVWAGLVTPYRRKVKTFDYTTEQHKNIVIQHAEEMGRFKLGSTAIVLFGKDKINWLSHWEAGLSIKMGDVLGHIQ